MEVSPLSMVSYQDLDIHGFEENEMPEVNDNILKKYDSRMDAGDIPTDLWKDILCYFQKNQLRRLMSISSSFYIIIMNLLRRQKFELMPYQKLMCNNLSVIPNNDVNVRKFIRDSFILGVGKHPTWLLNIQMNSAHAFLPIHLMYAFIEYMEASVGSELYFYFFDLYCVYLEAYWKYSLYIILHASFNFGRYLSFLGGYKEYIAKRITITILQEDIKKIILKRYGMQDMYMFYFSFGQGSFLRNGSVFDDDHSQCVICLCKYKIKNKIRDTNIYISNQEITKGVGIVPIAQFIMGDDSLVIPHQQDIINPLDDVD